MNLDDLPPNLGRPPLVQGLALLARGAGKPFIGRIASGFTARMQHLGCQVDVLIGWRSTVDDMPILHRLQYQTSIFVNPDRPQDHVSAIEAYRRNAARLSDAAVAAILIRFAQWQVAELDRNPRRPRRLQGSARVEAQLRMLRGASRKFDEAYWQAYAARSGDKELLRSRIIRQQLEAGGNSLETSPGRATACLRKFGRREQVVTVYVDEAWSQPGNSVARDEMVFGGLLWAGAAPDRKRLPLPGGLCRRTVSLFEAMRTLEAAADAQPFVVTIKTPTARIQAKAYIEYLQYALAVAIGWLMPGDGWASQVRLVMEGAGFAGFPPGTDGTHRMAGYFDALAAVCPHRFARWRVKEAVWLPTQSEYIGYADAIAYLGQGNPKVADIRTATHFEDFVPHLEVRTDRFSRLLAGEGLPLRQACRA